MVHFEDGCKVAERNTYDEKLVKIGQLLREKRQALGQQYSSRERFIEQRSLEILGGRPWISCRHLANLENGKNWPSIEMLIQLAYALEMNPVALFQEILEIYNT